MFILVLFSWITALVRAAVCSSISNCLSITALGNSTAFSLEVCNNTFILLELSKADESFYALLSPSTSFGFECAFPNGEAIRTSDSTSFYYVKDVLIVAAPMFKCPDEGVYTCNISEGQGVLFFGVYRNSHEQCFVTQGLQVKLSIEVVNFFTQQLAAVLTCDADGLPATSSAWTLNNVPLESNSSTLLTNQTTTMYMAVLLLDSLVPGDYRCTLISSGIKLLGEFMYEKISFEESSHILVEGPPNIQKMSLCSTSVLEVWLLPAGSGTYSYKLLVRDVSLTTVANYTCLAMSTHGIITCVANNLTQHTIYQLVVVGEAAQESFLLPTAPVSVNISKPGKVGNLTVIPTGNGFLLTWDLEMPESLYDNVTIIYSCSCQDETMITETVTSDNNFLLDNLSPGINYSVLVRAQNAFGYGPQTMETIVQNKVEPFVKPTFNLTALNCTAMLISWEVISCLNNSGEPPMLLLQIAPTGQNFTTNPVILDTSEKRYTFTGLERHTRYIVQMAVINTVGVGEWTKNNEITQDSNCGEIPTTFITDKTNLPSPSGGITPYYFWITIGAVLMGVLLTLAAITVCIVCGRYLYKSQQTQSTLKSAELQFLSSLADITAHEDQVDNPDCVPLQNLIKGSQRCEKPYFAEFPTSPITAMVGESLIFSVRLYGYPEPRWQWDHKGEPLTPSSDVQIYPDGTVFIKSVSQGNGGTYRFTATNAGGREQAAVVLQIVEEMEEDRTSNKLREVYSFIGDQKPIPIEEFDKYVELNHANDNEPFRFLYASLQLPSNKQSKVGMSAESKTRNRYKGIVPYDDNRVCLRSKKGLDHDYINASYIDGYTMPRKFIATQGPMTNTVADFWRMVWQEECHTIVMITNTVEGHKIKCEEYCPPHLDCYQKQCGQWTISLNTMEIYANFTIRSLCLEENDSDSMMQLKHFQYTTWPDHGVPDNGSPLLVFHQQVLKHQATAGGPTLVHCSAGVGRTGTYIALDIALEQLEAENVVDLRGIINKMRMQRAKMVQTLNQFVFLYDTILEHALCGKTLVPTGSEFTTFMNQLDEEGKQTGRSGYEKHFQLLQRITPKLKDVNCTVAKCHSDRNRDGVVLPSDQRRVVLIGHDNNYINASFVDGYQQKRGYIIAQSPMQETVVDFWRAVLQHKCATIVMLCNLVENGKEVCYQYWPMENDSVVFNHYNIKSMSIEQSDEVIKRVFGLKDVNTGHCLMVTQFQVTSWLPDGQCPNHFSITSLIDKIQDIQRRTGNNPILVHCSDCVTRSGMFCATSVAVEQAKVERMLDIFQVVKTLKIQRPGSIPLLDHYITIYQLVTTYLSIFETYDI